MAWLKRMSSPKNWPIERKTHKFITSSRGPHISGLPLLTLVRDVLKLVDNGNEARAVIKKKSILIDGSPIKDPKYGLGLLDLVTIKENNKTYRIIIKDNYETVETEGEDAKLKICKVIDKKILKGGKIQMNLSGGRNIITDKSYKTNGSVLIELPDQKIKDYFEFANGNTVLITYGKKIGEVAKLVKIEKEHSRAWVELEGKEIEVPLDSVLIVGKDEPAIKLK